MARVGKKRRAENGSVNEETKKTKAQDVSSKSDGSDDEALEVSKCVLFFKIFECPNTARYSILPPFGI